ncbi:MAG: hypothetical protein KDK05_01305, partial [Candidatus Competibacteraceae bacterium]|nr:hypothetical protein [Candidatus Competibacteraceae bacterium]
SGGLPTAFTALPATTQRRQHRPAMQLIVTALDSEARPLLDQYRLRASANSGPFRLYGNDNILLIVSGIGRVNAAAASAYLAALAGPGVHSWLNIGIGGQRDYVLGSAWLASCIQLPNARQNWYPPLIFTLPCPAATVCTVDQPQLDYPSEHIYEMEAAGFYPTATRFSSGELVQCLKIISDNAEHAAERLRPAIVSDLVRAALEPIDKVLCALRELADELQQAEQYLTLPALPWRISVAQQHLLRELLRRYRIRFGATVDPQLNAYTNAKDCLRGLRQQLQQHPQHLAP